MPTYDFKCQDCGQVFEVFQSMFDPPPECVECSGETEKVLSVPAVKMREYLPLVEQEDGKIRGVRDRAKRNDYFESQQDARDKKLNKITKTMRKRYGLDP